MRAALRRLPALSFAFLATASACDRATTTAAPTGEPLLTGLGDHHHVITTSVPAAQQYFDQGLRLTYAFNHEEAIKSFKEAERLDSACALCYWGEALALGPNINAPMDGAAVAPAYSAIQKAVALKAKASEADQGFIDALAARYGPDSTAKRPMLDSAYATAMGALSKKLPDDLDAATLYAESLMDLQPWDYYTVGGTPKGKILEITSTLESVLKRDANHPGACHYYIHAVEASPTPERALPCAEKLAELMPEAGHIVHMPAHIYIRVGRYDDAIEHNHHAVSVDEAYIDQRHPDGMYPMMYLPHNYHFLWEALVLAGRGAEAAKAARDVTAHVPLEMVRQVPPAEFALPTPYYSMIRFSKWADMINEPAPPSDLRYTTAMWHYGRAVAFARTGKLPEARVERDSTAAIAAATPGDRIIGLNTAKQILSIAAAIAAGEVAMAEGKADEGVSQLRKAVAIEDGLTYDEPPDWPMPVRQALGDMLLAAKRPADAEAVYRQDLKRFPENGWSLRGLQMALSAQGKDAEAATVGARFKTAWVKADSGT